LSVPIGLLAWALGYDLRTRWLCVALIVVILPFFLAQSYGMVFRGRDRMGLDAWVSVANKAASLAFAVAALAFGAGSPECSWRRRWRACSRSRWPRGSIAA